LIYIELEPLLHRKWS